MREGSRLAELNINFSDFMKAYFIVMKGLLRGHYVPRIVIFGIKSVSPEGLSNFQLEGGF